MSFNYCSAEPTYYYDCTGVSGCISYSGYKISGNQENYTINVGTYKACSFGEGPTPYTATLETHVPVGPTITYGTWNVMCGEQNPTPTDGA